MRFAVISDTHLKSNLEKLKDLVQSQMNNIDGIIHVGDYKDMEVVSYLKGCENFFGVYGNIDCREVREVLNEKEILDVEGYRIGLFHGHGEKKTTFDRAYEMFKDDNVDIIIFGHSHQPLIKTKCKTLMLNPGSPTSKRKERWFSYIVLIIENDTIRAELRLF